MDISIASWCKNSSLWRGEILKWGLKSEVVVRIDSRRTVWAV